MVLFARKFHGKRLRYRRSRNEGGEKHTISEEQRISQQPTLWARAVNARTTPHAGRGAGHVHRDVAVRYSDPAAFFSRLPPPSSLTGRCNPAPA